MRRIVIMGPPGSGKSTFARRLGDALTLPVFHLDQMYHLPNWVAKPKAIFRAEVEEAAALPAWVIDGNYVSTLASRFAVADTLILLDVPTRLRMARVIQRIAAHHGEVRPDSAEGCPERLDWAFLRYAWRWNRDVRARVMEAVQDFAGNKIILASPRAQQDFLNALPQA